LEFKAVIAVVYSRKLTLNSERFVLLVPQGYSLQPQRRLQMSDHHDADLILKLYDLRREATMREARNWFFTFNPTSVQDVIDTLLGEHSGHYRMVVSYWDMAAAMVNNGSIDEQLFNETNGEHLFVYAKIAPVIEEVRGFFGNPDFLQNLEKLVKRIPNVDEKISALTERMKKVAALRAERTAQAQAAVAGTDSSYSTQNY
jgi:hypothetical protein